MKKQDSKRILSGGWGMGCSHCLDKNTAKLFRHRASITKYPFVFAAYRQKLFSIVILFECFCEILSFVRNMGDVILPAAGIILQRNDAHVGFPESLSECCGGGGPLLDRQRLKQNVKDFLVPIHFIA